MFDLRYHVASLAAVFLALVVGIVVGIGISDRGVADETELRILRDDLARLRAERDTARRQAENLADEQRAASELIEEAYPALVERRLAGMGIALVFVGSVDPAVRASIERALADAGASGLLRTRALRLPLHREALRDGSGAVHPVLARYATSGDLRDLGRALGEEFVQGGETPLWEALSENLVEERSGTSRRPADGVVVAAATQDVAAAESGFLRGFYAGLAVAGSPPVGVETASVTSSAIASYRKAGFSTVDNVETPLGRLALVLLLGGARPGHYGLKPTASDGAVPPIEERAPRTVAGG